MTDKKSIDAPSDDAGRIEMLTETLQVMVDEFYAGYDPEDDPDGDELPGWVVHAEQVLIDCKP